MLVDEGNLCLEFFFLRICISELLQNGERPLVIFASVTQVVFVCEECPCLLVSSTQLKLKRLIFRMRVCQRLKNANRFLR